jgi:hypothetical protein
MDEEPVPQFEEDTLLTELPARAGTHSEWPPEPPPPAEVDVAFAQGTTPPRRAAIYTAVRRPTTSSER